MQFFRGEEFMTESEPFVVGIDLSLTGTGLADSSGLVCRYETTGHAGATWAQRWARICEISAQVTHWTFIGTEPDLVVIEGPSYGSGAGAGVWDRAGLWWWVYESLHDQDVPIVVVPPKSRALYATGKGAAGKTQVVEAVTRRWGHLWTELGSDDVADACVLVAMGRHALGYPLTDMPQSHARALKGVPEWAGLGELVTAS